MYKRGEEGRKGSKLFKDTFEQFRDDIRKQQALISVKGKLIGSLKSNYT